MPVVIEITFEGGVPQPFEPDMIFAEIRHLQPMTTVTAMKLANALTWSFHQDRPETSLQHLHIDEERDVIRET